MPSTANDHTRIERMLVICWSSSVLVVATMKRHWVLLPGSSTERSTIRNGSPAN